MAFNNMDMEEFETEEQGSPPPEQASNRNFLIVAGGLAALLVLTLICVVVYGMVILPANRRSQQTSVAEINAQNTAIELSSQQTSTAAKFTKTSQPTATRPPGRTVQCQSQPLVTGQARPFRQRTPRF